MNRYINVGLMQFQISRHTQENLKLETLNMKGIGLNSELGGKYRERK